MKFVCESCTARYVIDDERVRGKVLRIRCKECGHVMEVREPVRPAEAGSANVPRGARRATVAFDQPILTESPRDTSADEPPWYYSVNGESFGPYREDELIDRFQNGSVGDEAFLWQQGFDDWKPAATIPVFSAALRRGRSSARRANRATMSLDAEDLAALRAAAEAAIAGASASTRTPRPSDRESTERAAHEAKQRADREAREANERAEREANERAEREAKEEKQRAERETHERADREARERAEREAQERAEREARERADRDAQERADREARERAERERIEEEDRLRRARADREAADRRAREQREQERRAEQERLEALRQERLSAAIQRQTRASLEVETVPSREETPSHASEEPVGVSEAVTEPVPLPAELLRRSRERTTPTVDAPTQDGLAADDATPMPQRSPSVPVARDAEETTGSYRAAETAPSEEGGSDSVAGMADEAPTPVPTASATTTPATPAQASKTPETKAPSTTSPDAAEPKSQAIAGVTSEPKPRRPKATSTSKTSEGGATEAALFDLDAAIASVPVHTVGVPTVPIEERPRRTPLILAIAATVVAVGIGIYYAMQPSPVPPTPPTATRGAADAASASGETESATAEPATAEGSTEAAPALTPQQLARIADGYRLTYRRTDRAVDLALHAGMEAVIARLSEGRTDGAMSANRIEQLREQQEQRRVRSATGDSTQTASATTRVRPTNGSEATSGGTTGRERTGGPPTAPQGVFGELGMPAVAPTVAPRTGRAESAQGATTEQFQRGLSSFVQQSVSRCKTRAVADEGEMASNRVELELRVRTDGTVESVDAGRAFAGSAFQRCLQSHMGRWNFGPFPGEPITLRRTYIVQ
jgi:predicted Zn finger-like uncharacterized protein